MKTNFFRILACMICFTWLAGCAPVSQDDVWSLVYKADQSSVNLARMFMDTAERGLFFARLGHSQFYYFPTEDFKLPAVRVSFDDSSVSVYRICFTDQVWIVTNDYKLYTYLPADNRLDLYREAESFGEINACSVGAQGGLLIWGADWWALYQDEWQNEEVDFKIDSVAQDQDGVLWLITQDGEVYRRDNNTWKLFGVQTTTAEVLRLYITDRTLWICSRDGVYQWHMDAESPKLVIPLDEKEISPFETIKKDQFGAIWVLSHNAIWQVKGEQVTKVEFPKGVSSLDGVAYDSKHDIIYANTSDAVYTLNVQEFTEQRR